MKRIKPAERNARPFQVVSIVAVRYLVEAANERVILDRRPPRPVPHRQCEWVVGKGKYLGHERTVWAFVWLDDQTDAANDPEAVSTLSGDRDTSVSKLKYGGNDGCNQA